MRYSALYIMVWRLLSGAVLAADMAVISGKWQRQGLPPVWHQVAVTEEIAEAVLSVPGAGSAWRCVVEPGPYSGRAGVGFACKDTGKGGYQVIVSAAEGGALRLLGPDQQQLWQDAGIGWMPYMVVWVELVLEETRVRVQLLESDGITLLAQSPWLPVQPGTLADESGFAVLSTAGTTARFCALGRHPEALTPYTPDNPSVLRVPRAGETAWTVIGGGRWRWENRNRNTLLQTRRVERTTAFQTSPLTTDGTWQCRIRLDASTCGGGMLVHADESLTKGFLIWLGGTYGDGGLLVYRYPLQAMWGGPQGAWHWDTDYVLTCTIEEGMIQAALLAADGTTSIQQSPKLPIVEEDRAPNGMLGYQTWHGTGRFSGFAPDRLPSVAAVTGSLRLTDIGGGWEAASGEWAWSAEDPECLRQEARDGMALARCSSDTVRGSRGTTTCKVTRDDADVVSLLFQMSPDMSEGFEVRYDGISLQLRDGSGVTLWQAPAPPWPPDGAVVLTGVVATDRITVRLSDGSGVLLLESPDRYVSDANNDRIGTLGVRCEGGRADFRHWGWTAE